MRGLQWFVTLSKLDYAYIGRHTLAVLGLDNRNLLSAERDRVGSIVDMQESLKRAAQRDDPFADGATSIGSIITGKKGE